MIKKNKKIKNEVVVVKHYATEELQEILTAYGNYGYKLISAIMAKNEYDIEAMYLFFTKEEDNK